MRRNTSARQSTAVRRRHELLAKKVKACRRCERLVRSRRQAVMGYGDLKAEILIVGEAPGHLGADITGVPFTQDRSGVFLQRLLHELGLNRSSPDSVRPELRHVYITNIVRCNPRGKGGTNRPPTRDEIGNCRDYLEQELEIIRPRLVVTLGLSASREFLGREFSGGGFGRIHQGRRFAILPLWHPAFVVRGGGAQKMTEKRYRRYFGRITEFLA